MIGSLQIFVIRLFCDFLALKLFFSVVQRVNFILKKEEKESENYRLKGGSDHRAGKIFFFNVVKVAGKKSLKII